MHDKRELREAPYPYLRSFVEDTARRALQYSIEAAEGVMTG